MSKTALCSLLLCCLAVASPRTASSSEQEVVSASALTLLSRVVGIATQVTQDDGDGYSVRVLQLYPLGENGTAEDQDISSILAAGPAALFVSNPSERAAFVGVALGQNEINSDPSGERIPQWLESAREDLARSLAARGKSEAHTRRIGLSALHLMPWPWASDRRRGGRRRCG